MLKSCGTCRTRRRACDKAKPTCGTCKTSGHLCSGYADTESKIFVNFDSKNLTRRKKRVLGDAIRDHNHHHHQATTSPDKEPGSSEDEVLGPGPVFGNPTFDPRPSYPPVQTGRVDELGSLGAHDIRFAALNCMFMSRGEFQQHIAALWQYFAGGHNMTSDGWAPSLNHLLLHNQSLDLALVSLSTMRLSQTSGQPRYKVLSLTSYDRSMRIFRRICTGGCGVAAATKTGNGSGGNAGSSPLTQIDRRKLAMLSITSLAYAFIESTQTTPLGIFNEGLATENPHLDGCLVFLRAAGPRAFSRAGTHRVFRKIRELEVVTAMARREPSMLAHERWINDPWRFHGKTPRDRLYDIVTRITLLVAYAMGKNAGGRFRAPQRAASSSSSSSSSLESQEGSPIPTTAEEFYVQVRKELHEWYYEWSNPPRYAGLPVPRQEPPPLTDRVEDNFDAKRLFLQTEVHTLRLILALVAVKMNNEPRRQREGSVSSGAGDPAAAFPTAEQARRDAMVMARAVKASLDLPLFNLRSQFGPGIVEGQCRSIMPVWSLIEYGRVMGAGSGIMDPESEINEDAIPWF